MAASKTGPRAPTTVGGQRRCRLCREFKPADTEHFPVRRWADEDKTVVRYFQSECRSCRAEQEMLRHFWATPVERERRRTSSRIWHRRRRRQRGVPETANRVRSSRRPAGTVPREPFARWLQEKIDQTSIEHVCTVTGINQRRVYLWLRGYTRSRLSTALPWKRRLKLYPVDWVDLDVVDRALVAWEESPFVLEEMYPLGDTDEDESLLLAA